MAWYDAGGAPTPMAAYQAIAAASYAASKQNILSPGTHDLADGAAYPTWDASYGWAYDATQSQYLASDIKPNLASFDVCTIIRVSDFSHTGAPIAARNMFGLSNYDINAAYFTDRVYFKNGAGGSYYDTVITSGVFCINGRGGGDQGAYLDGLKLFDIASSSTGQNYTMAVGAFNSAGTYSNFFNGKIQALVHYDQLLTAAQVLAVSTAMAGLPDAEITVDAPSSEFNVTDGGYGINSWVAGTPSATFLMDLANVGHTTISPVYCSEIIRRWTYRIRRWC